LLLSRSTSLCIPIDAEGLVFGVLEEEVFEEKRFQLQEGDIFLIYTDGIVEATNARGEMLGRSRLCAILGEAQMKPPEEIIDTVLKEVSSFRDGISFDDDVTIVVMKVK
jgi:sigma-B regulation protein RsbU (phosphoserine phosphatase)